MNRLTLLVLLWALSACRPAPQEAITQGDIEAVRAHVAEGGPNQSTADGVPLLLAAVLAGQPEIVELLISASADPSATDPSGRTLLEALRAHPNPAVTRAAVTPAALAALLTSDGLGELKELLALGADPADMVGQAGVFPLHLACITGDVNVVRLQLTMGMAPDHPTSSGLSPLALAGWWEQEAVARVLVDAGARIGPAETDAAIGAVRAYLEEQNRLSIDLDLQDVADDALSAITAELSGSGWRFGWTDRAGRRGRVSSDRLDTELLRFIEVGLLSPNPDWTYDYGLRSRYHIAVPACLPRHLQELTCLHRYDDGTTYYGCDSRFLDRWPTLVHLIDRRPENIESLYRRFGASALDLLTLEMYAAEESSPSALVQDLLRARRLLSSTSAETLRAAVDAASADPCDRDSAWQHHREHYGHLAEGLSSHQFNPTWLASFWARRESEGNAAVVERILREVDERFRAQAVAGAAEESAQTDSTQTDSARDDPAQSGSTRGESAPVESAQGTEVFQYAYHSEWFMAESLAAAHRIGDLTHANGTPLLALAAESNRYDLIETLLKNGAQVDRADAEGRTPLHWTARRSLWGNVETIAMLLVAGADLEARTSAGETALVLAADQPTVVAALLEAGADPNVADPRGVTALMVVLDEHCRGEHRANAERMIDAGADVSARDVAGRTALMWLLGSDCRAGDRELFDRLLTAGARVSDRDKNGRTPLMFVAGQRHHHRIGWLMQQEVSVTEADMQGRTALMIAAAAGHRKNVAALLKSGADRTAVDSAGRTALDHARAHPRIAALLAP